MFHSLHVKTLSAGLVGIAISVLSSIAAANPIVGDECGISPNGRMAKLTGAAQCAYGTANPDGATVAGYYGGTWVKEGELAGSSGSNDLLSVTTANWGAIPASGTYSIDPSFWLTWGRAVITMHVGGGSYEPEHFAWLLTSGTTSGSFDLWKTYTTPGGGGGLSNLKLWGEGEPSIPLRPMPEPGALALLGLGLMGMVLVRYRVPTR